MRIIQLGTKLGGIDIQTECQKCGTIFEWNTIKDGTYHSHQQDGSYFKVECPVCKHPAYHGSAS